MKITKKLNLKKKVTGSGYKCGDKIPPGRRLLQQLSQDATHRELKSTTQKKKRKEETKLTENTNLLQATKSLRVSALLGFKLGLKWEQ